MAPRDKSSIIALGLMILSSLVFAAAVYGLSEKVECVRIWFYCLAWWSYILFLEAWLHLRSETSLLFRSPRSFLGVAFLSIQIWLIFEVYNFRLHNWHYVGLPPNRLIRWAGYALSYATVVPGLLATRRLLEAYDLFSTCRWKPIKNPQAIYIELFIIGALFLLLPVVWPRVFFPLVWLGFTFLLEPLNHKWQTASLLADLHKGLCQRLMSLLAAGMICGLLWEAWNFWAGSKWYYTIPYFGWFKLFEMPALGFLGFPPFAVECYVMLNTCLGIKTRATKFEKSWLSNKRTWKLGFLALVLADLIVFSLIDYFTVVGYVK